ncbi:hypothetical protein AgCh_013754 [Apium graveolens]
MELAHMVEDKMRCGRQKGEGKMGLSFSNKVSNWGGQSAQSPRTYPNNASSSPKSYIRYHVMSVAKFSPCLSTVGATITGGLQERGKESESIEHLTFTLDRDSYGEMES